MELEQGERETPWRVMDHQAGKGNRIRLSEARSGQEVEKRTAQSPGTRHRQQLRERSEGFSGCATNKGKGSSF